MEQIVSAVMDAVHRAGLVEVEVSARHVHLSQADVEVLFGPGARLEPKRPLSQPGQFLSEQRVTLVGPKGRKERVAVLGPARKATQVELSKSDCMELGVKAPVRESGRPSVALLRPGRGGGVPPGDAGRGDGPAAESLPRAGTAGGMRPLSRLRPVRRGLSCRPAGRALPPGLPDAPEDAGARLPAGGEIGVVEYVENRVSR